MWKAQEKSRKVEPRPRWVVVVEMLLLLTCRYRWDVVLRGSAAVPYIQGRQMLTCHPFHHPLPIMSSFEGRRWQRLVNWTEPNTVIKLTAKVRGISYMYLGTSVLSSLKHVTDCDCPYDFRSSWHRYSG